VKDGQQVGEDDARARDAIGIARADAFADLLDDGGDLFGVRISGTFLAPGGGHFRIDAAARGNSPVTVTVTGLAAANHVAQETVYDVLLEDAEVAVGKRVHLEGLEFEAGACRAGSGGSACRSRAAGLGQTAVNSGSRSQFRNRETGWARFRWRAAGGDAGAGVLFGVL